jgi:Fe-S-cluster containining protein
MAADQHGSLKRRATLAQAAASYQERAVIPHCRVCARPCCKLDELVLDLDWRRTQKLYRIGTSRRAFDRSLHEGTGPAHIREAQGRYYAHGAPCPAYDEEGRGCRVYGSDLKPEGCSDFPVYRDGDVVTADLRCEAVDVAALQLHLEAETGRPLRATPDAQFPFFVAFAPVRKPR